MAPAITHTTIRPERRENEHRVHTVERIHHHIRPTIQPVTERQSLPTRFYLETGPGQMHEISAQEARQYGEPVWNGETLVQLSGEALVQPGGEALVQSSGVALVQPSGVALVQPHGEDRGGNYSTQQDTIHTRVPTPPGTATAVPREAAEPPTPQKPTTHPDGDVYGRAEGHDVVTPAAAGNMQHELDNGRGLPAITRMDTFGRSGSRRSGTGIGAGAGAGAGTGAGGRKAS